LFAENGGWRRRRDRGGGAADGPGTVGDGGDEGGDGREEDATAARAKPCRNRGSAMQISYTFRSKETAQWISNSAIRIVETEILTYNDISMYNHPLK